MTPGPADVAQLRGAFVGGTSGAVSIAAHAIGGGGMAPSESAVALLLFACASVGAVVSSIDIRRSPAIALALMLAAGQAIGHITLTIASEHPHGLHPTFPMLAAHIAAIGVCALLIRAAEHGYVVAASTVAAIVAVLLRPATPEPASTSMRTRYRAKVVLRQLVTSGTGTRGPPAIA
ncbi:hypothetical protein [Rhodococcus sp. ARC_M6]|uniref:hypothetical protein n=1 Tax=Rhodococcus sp. ARC_M6 TaxID=2928852 RepID=UPI001FB45059|nr:hypothetical protein [Rhodococcus sp. ARC_M6]MCJ0902080.1 hypothetical protein [Rhodococcus sp. ARC_M6]